MNKLTFFSDCVSWDRKDVAEGLIPMIDNNLKITRKTFLSHVDEKDLVDLETQLGYEQHYKKGMVMSQDYAVTYHRSKLHEETVYYFRHSAIEYVFG